MKIRPSTLDDIPATDLIRQASEPWHVASLATQRLWFTATPEAAHELRLTALIDDEVAGSGTGGLDLYAAEPGAATVRLCVHPRYRRRGVASALYQRFEQHLTDLGATQIQAHPLDEADSTAFAEHRGYVLGATDRFAVVDPGDLPPQPATPPGVEIRTAAQAGPEPFHAVSDTAARDEPGDVEFGGIPYDQWLERYWPMVDRDLSMLALVDGVPAATTALNVNATSARAMSIGSDTLREFRGRGLIKLLKSVSLRAAAAHGITAAYTANDEVNAPIRAINAWLGYRDVGAIRSAVKKL